MTNDLMQQAREAAAEARLLPVERIQEGGDRCVYAAFIALTKAKADSDARVAELEGACNLAYGLLWNCSVDTRTVTGRCTSEARKALLATMTKTAQAASIDAARALLTPPQPEPERDTAEGGGE